MKLYLSADMEGTAAVASWTQVDPTNTTEYPYYRRLMSREVRAAIDGAREAGVTDVLVNDSHSSMRNVMWDELPDDVRMIYGNRKPFSMSEGVDTTFGAAFFTGYHAGVGEANGTLDHTYTSETLYNTRVNGVRCNEAILNAAVVGTHGVPVVLITGDRVTIEGTRAVLPWITGVVVKESIGRFAVNSVSPERARGLIRAGAIAAIRTVAAAKPFVFEPPIALEIDFVTISARSSRPMSRRSG
jgi:D-amino peptidase